MPDIAALFYSLPDETYKKEVIVLAAGRASWSYDHQEEIIFTFAHDEVDYAVLARFLDRARRVRAIVSASKYYQTHLPRRALVAASSVYAALARTLASRPLLPSLQVLDYTRSARMDFDIFDVLDVLISPKLKHFGVESHGHMWRRSVSPPEDWSSPGDASPLLQGKLQGEAQFCNMLGKLRDRAQSLQTFEVVVKPSSPSIMSAITTTLCDFRQFVVLSVNAWSFEPVDSATPAFFAYCAQLLCLRELYILLDDPPTPHDWRLQVSSQLPPNCTSFPSLRQFHPNVKDLALITGLLPLIHSTELETLSVCACGDIRRDQIRPFFAGIASLPAREHLQ
ncbi:hypothetical protein GY45DRAFT_926003 [Cubamyces sp. BRFM 1775]|nr:hypothetical protein GY45DRAFT_926003 [Cubamyces sp. BRFM 1775]